MSWQNNGISGLRNDQVCLFPANNPMETTKWKVNNTRLKEVVCSLWIYCRIPRLFPEFDSAWRPCRGGCSLALPCLCFTGIAKPSRLYRLFLPSAERSCVLTRGVLRERIFITLKWFGIEDTVTLLGREADRGLKCTFCKCGCADFYSISPSIKWESPSFILADDLGCL